MLPKSSLSQQGYIAVAVIVFMLVLAAFIFPWKFPKKESQDCVVGEKPETEEILTGLPAVNSIDEDPAIAEFGGGPDPVLKADYVLIRKNVPADSYAMTHIRAIQSPQPKPGYYLAYPSSDGGKHVEAESTMDLRLRHEGLIFFVDPKLTQPAKVVVRKEGPNRGQTIDDTVQLVDVYQDKRKFDEEGKGYETEDLFRCGSEAAIDRYSITVPNQAVSPDRTQLQLEWFLLAQQGVWGLHCKPAVYLYPEKKQLVNVKVYPKGELSYTDPPYDPSSGWTVEAYPNGNLYQVLSKEQPSYGGKYQGIKNNYLYYESKLLDSEITKPQRGWVVKPEEMENLLNRILPKLGLNEKEANDFKNYWLSKLPDSPYYFVGLVDKSQRDYLETLDVTPNPDTSIRFSLYFEMLDEPKNVEEPVIQTPKRNGFTLVDWGGMVKLHPGTPFTCSQ